MDLKAPRDPYELLLRHELSVMLGNWLAFLLLGVGLIVLGTIAVGAAFAATTAVVTVLGVCLLFAGTTQCVGAFLARRWSGFFALLLTGILYLAVGVLSIEHPAQFAAGLTLVIALFLIAGGAFRIIAALTIRFPNWLWLLLNGLVTLLLGVLIWRQWPDSGHWVIGLFVGIEMILNGWTWVFLALALRKARRLPL